MKSLPATIFVASLLAGIMFCLFSAQGAPQPSTQAAAQTQIPNPKIDYPRFMQEAAEVQELRAKRRVTEDEFIRMAADASTIILDARSADKYALLHVKGAISLPLTDFTAEELAKVIPDPNTRVLIYCNNNFENERIAFASKVATASLNIYTFNSLYNYGYRNVYELGPLLDAKTTKLEFAGTMSAPADLEKALPGKMPDEARAK